MKYRKELDTNVVVVITQTLCYKKKSRLVSYAHTHINTPTRTHTPPTLISHIQTLYRDFPISKHIESPTQSEGIRSVHIFEEGYMWQIIETPNQEKEVAIIL